MRELFKKWLEKMLIGAFEILLGAVILFIINEQCIKFAELTAGKYILLSMMIHLLCDVFILTRIEVEKEE